MGAVLVTGALGQIGSALVPTLVRAFGPDAVIASDIRHPTSAFDHTIPYELLDCTDQDQVLDVVQRRNIGTIYHLAAILSAVGEDKPQAAWHVNMAGLAHILEAARLYDCAVFFPSSIAAFGPGTPRDGTPQVTIQRPNTIYGITKVTGEMLCDYYHARFGTNARGLRLPGVLSYSAPPGGGTTDYAVDIFHGAVRGARYTSYLKPDTRLPMMYMPDAVRAMCELMAAQGSRLVHRNAYNVAAMNFTPSELAAAIKMYVPDFVIDYKIDPARQAIAESWPRSLDDSAARREWDWQPGFDLDAMVSDMLAHLPLTNP
ncbi:MAG: NAD-dependent epimerase/dehydratase family protein [Hyphomicrobiales bacterium]|nr:NAD-dependent epimerase/dehydratase family protein [Hyphomicrobiales bacterium]MCP5001026.1 NAD-dependent epimerase/dehydratase family protein [Hyphomicrobiales bacterium]